MASIKELVGEIGRLATVDMMVTKLNMRREYAEFVVAMSLGENDGDTILIEDGQDDSQD